MKGIESFTEDIDTGVVAVVCSGSNHIRARQMHLTKRLLKKIILTG
jgi:hypothetical protein